MSWIRRELLIGLAMASGCSAQPAPSAPVNANVPAHGPEVASAAATVIATSTAAPSAESAPHPETKPAPCTVGMQHVETSYCPDMKRECVDEEYDEPNRITICHGFREGKNDCQQPRVVLDYCIDEFEYPNRQGEKPPVMVSFYDAEKACSDLGKRVCKESEWVAACEGPEETPFPYGWRRSSAKCNFDQKWIAPSLARIYSKDAAIQRAELERLDRSAPSGSLPECKSGFGVFDLTGNVDEWVRADTERERRRSRFAGLKGGAWGHVRNACRPVTTSHAPDFKYYFIGFRCCSDVKE